jgi:chromosome segregation ATPase
MQLHAPSFVFGNLAGTVSQQNFYASSVGQQRQTDEVRHLKLIIERLSSKLREY